MATAAAATGHRLRQTSGSTATASRTRPHGSIGRPAGGAPGHDWAITDVQMISTAVAAAVIVSLRAGLIRDSTLSTLRVRARPPLLRWEAPRSARLRPGE
ncbi:hypothetical protein GCM10027570_24340 [Streptomonospora sediminis]